MTEEQMIARAKESPALKWQSDRGGRNAYPANYRGRVPLKVTLAKTVKSDLPSFVPHQPAGIIANKDKEYYVWVNSYGAVAAILPNGRELGLIPSEFDVIAWHENID